MFVIAPVRKAIRAARGLLLLRATIHDEPPIRQVLWSPRELGISPIPVPRRRISRYNLRMMTRISAELEQAVDEHNGALQLEGALGSYVLLSEKQYRELMGIGTVDEYQASVEAIRKGCEEARTGRTSSLEEFVTNLGK
jgi:hypothetical protein